MPSSNRRRSKGAPSQKADLALITNTGQQEPAPAVPNPLRSPSDEWLDDPDPPSTDPTRIATGLLLQRAITSVGPGILNAIDDGLVCVIVLPSAKWVEFVLEEWRGQVCHYQDGWDGYRRPYEARHAWAYWAPTELPRPFETRELPDHFAVHVSEGRHCVGISSDTSWLPPDLVNAVDYTLQLPSLTAGDVSQLAEILSGTPPADTLVDEEAALLTPRLLRLARRPRQTSDAYVAKLRDVLQREPRPTEETKPIRSSSVREEPTLDRLHGMDEAVSWGRRVIVDLQAYRAGTIAWADVDRGCLLSGPPGCGKTLFARALATSCDAQLVTGSYGQWLGTGSGHQGDLLKAMKKSFDKARARTPSILFIDEVDSFPNRATISHHYADWEMQVVNALLAEIDGTESREGVILVAACNHPDKLDPALIRSGRLDRHIRIRLPDEDGLERILREHLAGDLDGADLSGVVLGAVGATGADCERFVRGARRRGREAGRPMKMADLTAEIMGGGDLTDEDLWLYGVHEAGHAVASCVLRPGTLVAVALRPRGDTMGETASVVRRGPVGLQDIRCELAFTLAGRAAEEIVFGEVSGGSGGTAGSDLAEATVMAATAIGAFGLDRASGLVWSGIPTAGTVAATLAANPAMAQRVRLMLDEAYKDAVALLRLRQNAVEALAAALVARRVVDGLEVATMVADAAKARKDYRKQRRPSRTREAAR